MKLQSFFIYTYSIVLTMALALVYPVDGMAQQGGQVKRYVGGSAADFQAVGDNVLVVRAEDLKNFPNAKSSFPVTIIIPAAAEPEAAQAALNRVASEIESDAFSPGNDAFRPTLDLEVQEPPVTVTFQQDTRSEIAKEVLERVQPLVADDLGSSVQPTSTNELTD
jgi:hypothetical protein